MYVVGPYRCKHAHDAKYCRDRGGDGGGQEGKSRFETIVKSIAAAAAIKDRACNCEDEDYGSQDQLQVVSRCRSIESTLSYDLPESDG